MKRKIIVIVAGILVAIAIAVGVIIGVGASKKAEVVSKSDTMVVIQVNKTKDFETFLDVMNYLKEKGKLNFELSGGAVSSIEGKSASNTASWALYSSDSENSDVSWGKVTYEGTICGMVSVVLEELPVVEGAYYVWKFI